MAVPSAFLQNVCVQLRPAAPGHDALVDASRGIAAVAAASQGRQHATDGGHHHPRQALRTGTHGPAFMCVGSQQCSRAGLRREGTRLAHARTCVCGGGGGTQIREL